MITMEQAKKVLETVDAGLVNGLGNPVPGQMCVEAAVCYALGLKHSDDPICVSEALRKLKIHLNDSPWSSPEARAKGMRRLALVQLGTKDTLDEREFVKRVAAMTIRTVLPPLLRKAGLNEVADRCEKKGSYEAAYAAYAADAAAYAAADAADAAAAAARSAARYAADAANAASDAADAAADAAAYAAYAAAYAADAAAYAADAAAYAVSAARSAVSAARSAADAADAGDKILSDFAENVVQILVGMNVESVKFLKLAPV